MTERKCSWSQKAVEEEIKRERQAHKKEINKLRNGYKVNEVEKQHDKIVSLMKDIHNLRYNKSKHEREIEALKEVNFLLNEGIKAHQQELIQNAKIHKKEIDEAYDIVLCYIEEHQAMTEKIGKLINKIEDMARRSYSDDVAPHIIISELKSLNPVPSERTSSKAERGGKD